MFKWSNVPVGRADPNAELVGGKQGIKFTRTIVKREFKESEGKIGH